MWWRFMLYVFQLSYDLRTFKLYQLFVTCDEHAVKALIEILKCQCAIRQQIKQVYLTSFSLTFKASAAD